MYRNPTWKRALCLAAILWCGDARADYDAGQAAWQAGRHTEALTHWRAAATTGDARAMLALGRAFAKGLGVPQDYILAHMWLNLAAGRGSAEAAKERDALAATMIPQHIASAQERARAWLSGRRADAPKAKVVPRVATPTASAGPPPRAIQEAQGLMAVLGYKPGSADGRWGPRTGKAYAAFLRDAGLPLAEVLTPDALRAMRAAAKGRNVAATTASPRPAPASQRQADPPPADLHRLVAAGDIDGLKAALAKGADANARDGKGWTALMHAADKGQALLIPLLLKAGADPNSRLADGATVLFIAAVHGHEEIVTELLNGGADPSIKGPQGKTAATVARAKFGGLEAARRNNASPEVLELLEKGIPSSAEIKDNLERAKSEIRSALLECGKFLLSQPPGHRDPTTRSFVQHVDLKFLESGMKVVLESRYYTEKNSYKSSSRNLYSFNFVRSLPLLQETWGNWLIVWSETSSTSTEVEFYFSVTGKTDSTPSSFTQDYASIEVCKSNKSEAFDGFKRLIALYNKFAGR